MNLINLKVAIRNASKNRIISFAKIFGLSIAFAVIMFAFSYVYYEYSFDKSISDANRIYRCLMQGHLNNEEADYAVTSAAQGPSLVAEVPEICESLRLLYQGNATLTVNKKDYINGNVYYSDPNFFSFWDLNLKSNVEEPLADNNSLLVSESIAKKQFGSAYAALGKQVFFRGEASTITGVFNDLPKNFHIQSDFFQSIHRRINHDPHWYGQSFYTYIKTVSPNMNIDDLNFKISKNVYTHYHDHDGTNAQTMDDLKYEDDFYLFYTAEPLSDIHFSVHKFDSAITANKTYVYGAIILAILVLLISTINFVNLSVANLSTRYKEIGIRKTIGALKAQILKQFVNETLLFFVISFVFALLIFVASGNPLANYLGFNIVLTQNKIVFILVSSLIILLLFVLSFNMVPVMLFSRNKVLNLIKGESKSKKQQWGSNGFVVIQFMLSLVIILFSVIMTKQINYIATKDKGYDSENILNISLYRLSDQERKSFIEQLESYPEIHSICSSDRYIGNDPGMDGAYFENNQDEDNYFHPSVLPVDANFAQTFDLQLKEGRFFDATRQTDEDAVLINEAAAAEYKKEGSLIGKTVIFNGGECTIIAIVKDFNFRSLHHPVEPLIMSYSENDGNVYMKIAIQESAKVISVLKSLWSDYNVNDAFAYSYLNDILADNYAKDTQAKKMLFVLSLLSICIACVGLYAVSFFSIIKKTKEIGIRKVNGATITELMTMLNIDFVRWVIAAFILAVPIAYFVMQHWLENFAYKTGLSWWIFGAAAIVALGIAILTVSWQSWRAATRNPVEALRYE